MRDNHLRGGKLSLPPRLALKQFKANLCVDWPTYTMVIYQQYRLQYTKNKLKTEMLWSKKLPLPWQGEILVPFTIKQSQQLVTADKLQQGEVKGFLKSAIAVIPSWLLVYQVINSAVLDRVSLTAVLLKVAMVTRCHEVRTKIKLEPNCALHGFNAEPPANQKQVFTQTIVWVQT